VILDSSSVLAILFREAGFERFEKALAGANSRSISAANFVEVCIVIESRGGDQALRQCDELFRQATISIEPVTEEQAYLARQAYSEFGKGRHRAGLNFGDCFAYALAKALGEPLLFAGDDFLKTDIAPALPPEPDSRS
jgi:ribonuclease VapC